MSEKMIVREALRRKEVFNKINYWLNIARETVKRLDSEGLGVYLFGSVAGGKYNLSSDIDLLVVTDLKPEVVIAELWKKGVKEPFEIHVIDRNGLHSYKSRSKLVSI